MDKSYIKQMNLHISALETNIKQESDEIMYNIKAVIYHKQNIKYLKNNEKLILKRINESKKILKEYIDSNK